MEASSAHIGVDILPLKYLRHHASSRYHEQSGTIIYIFYRSQGIWCGTCLLYTFLWLFEYWL